MFGLSSLEHVSNFKDRSWSLFFYVIDKAPWDWYEEIVFKEKSSGCCSSILFFTQMSLRIFYSKVKAFWDWSDRTCLSPKCELNLDDSIFELRILLCLPLLSKAIFMEFMFPMSSIFSPLRRWNELSPQQLLKFSLSF